MDVLVVDDNGANALLYERVIANLPGCTCRSFSDPSQALDWCGAQNPSLLIVDYAMPGMDGIEFVRRFRSISGCEQVPIVMLTGLNSARVREGALAAGASVFLTKPISKDRFLNEARRLLGIGVATP